MLSTAIIAQQSASQPIATSGGISIPHVADANARLSLPPDSAKISGAGTSFDNGLYTQRGTSGGKPYYNLIGAEDSTSASCIVWDGVHWIIYRYNSTTDYLSSDDVAYPWLVTTWTQDVGELPLPASTHLLITAGYQVIQDDNSTTYTFNGDGADADAGLWVTGTGDDEWNGPYQFLPDTGHGALYELIGAGNDVSEGPDWAMGGSYAISTSETYPWQSTWDPVSGTPPPPNVSRNPIASSANWTP